MKFKLLGNDNLGIVCLVVGILSGALFLHQRPSEIENIYVLYDETTEPFHPNSFEGVETIRKNNLNKLFEIGDLNKHSFLLSTIESPAINLNNTIEQKFHDKVPIYSLHNIIENSDINFVDLSFSDFGKDIVSGINPEDKHIILFEREYEKAELWIKKEIDKSFPDLTPPSIRFEIETMDQIDLKDKVVIFIGSSSGISNIIETNVFGECKKFIIPNWLRQSIPSLMLQKPKNGECYVSNLLDKMIEKDLEVWEAVYRNINENSNKNELRNKILGEFPTQNGVKKVNF